MTGDVSEWALLEHWRSNSEFVSGPSLTVCHRLFHHYGLWATPQHLFPLSDWLTCLVILDCPCPYTGSSRMLRLSVTDSRWQCTDGIWVVGESLEDAVSRMPQDTLYISVATLNSWSRSGWIALLAESDFSCTDVCDWGNGLLLSDDSATGYELTANSKYLEAAEELLDGHQAG